MPTKEAERALKCIDVLAHRRDDRGLVTPITGSAMLQALDEDQRAGVALGQARSVLDYACIEARVPLLGQLILMRDDEAWGGAWSEWAQYRRLIHCAPRLTIWRDAQLHAVRSVLASIQIGAIALWQEAEPASTQLLVQAVDIAQAEIARFVSEGLHAPSAAASAVRW